MHGSVGVDTDLPGRNFPFANGIAGGDAVGDAVAPDFEAHVATGSDLAKPDIVLGGAIAVVEHALVGAGVQIVKAGLDRQAEGAVNLLALDVVDRRRGHEVRRIDQRDHVDAQHLGNGGDTRLVDCGQHPDARQRDFALRKLDFDGVAIDDLVVEFFEARIRVAGMGARPGADHGYHRDVRGIIDGDAKGLAGGDIGGRPSNDRTLGEVAIGIEQIGGHVDLRIEVNQRPRRATATREHRAIGQDQCRGMIEARQGLVFLIGHRIVGGVPDGNVLLRVGQGVALINRAAAADNGDATIGQRDKAGVRAGAVELGNAGEARRALGQIAHPEAAIIGRNDDLVGLEHQ